MNYAKPQIRCSGDALASIQGTQKGTITPVDSIDPSNPDHYLTQMAYEADE